ncbi:MAG: hypothetical protein AAF348_07555 [Bacteroidota bacterium]
MERLTASQAREYSSGIFEQELKATYKLIKEEAKKQKTTAFVYKQLEKSTIEILEEDGFHVHDASDICVQRDSLYHTIKW